MINAGSWWLRFLRRRRAKKYYLAVKYFGKKAFMENKDGINNKFVILDEELKSKEFKIFKKKEFKKVA